MQLRAEEISQIIRQQVEHYDQKVAVANEFSEIAHVQMARRTAALIDQQTRRIARLQWNLRDSIVGKFVLEVGEPHGCTTLRRMRAVSPSSLADGGRARRGSPPW